MAYILGMGRSFFLVVKFTEGPYGAAVYEIKAEERRRQYFHDGERRCGQFIDPVVAFFSKDDESDWLNISADIEGSQICLVASASKFESEPLPGNIYQLSPVIYDIETDEDFDLPMPQATKSIPCVIAVKVKGKGCFYVLNGGTCCGVPAEYPLFERLDADDYMWDDDDDDDDSGLRLPDLHVRDPHINGYVVVNDEILISVNDGDSGETKYFAYKLGSSMDDWNSVKIEKDENPKVPSNYVFHVMAPSNYGFDGKAEYYDGVIYVCNNYGELIAYNVFFRDDDHTIERLGVPHKLNGQKFLALDYRNIRGLCSSGFVHIGKRMFGIARFGHQKQTRGGQYVEVSIVRVSESMEVTLLTQEVYGLSTISMGLAGSRGMGTAVIKLLCVKCRMSQNKEDLQPENTDATKMLGKGVASSAFSGKRIGENVEPVDDFLRSLSLEKYLTTFKDEEIDMAILPRITDEELGLMGLPLGAREKIRMSLHSKLHSESIDCFLRQLGLEKYSTKFKDEEIDTAILSLMTEEELKILGLPRGPRKKILLEFKV